MNMRMLCVALVSAWLLASSCQTTKKCAAASDCQAGEVCAAGECQATGSNAGGGSGGSGGAGGSGGSGGGSIIVTGCDPSDSANFSKDSDCDGLSDAEEYSADLGNGAKTDPCNSDTDADGVADGVERGKTTSVACATFVGDADPNSKTNPTAADSDGDGLKDGDEDANHNGKRDPTEVDPTRKDTDCDGYSDGEESTSVPGCVTDGTRRDTDGDGLPDGVEAGLAPLGADPMGCTYSQATYDSDGTTKTDACNPDSDGDGIQDGAEDTNHNGKVDTGELDPRNGADGAGVVQQACATQNLTPVTFHSGGASDVQLALIPQFAEVSRLVTSTGEAGFIFYDPTTQVAGLALSKTPAGADGTAEEAHGRMMITHVSGPLTQNFTTWDGFGGSVRAQYDVNVTADVKDGLNALAQAYLGPSVTGLLTGQAGASGPFKVVAEYVWRAPTRAIVVVAAIPQNLYVGQALFRINDAAGGTALAQYGDYANTQCEVFNAAVNQKVDFLWVVDDSCSMESSQTAVANAGNLFGQKLASAGLDWRAAGVSTGWYGSLWHGSFRDWTNDLTTMRSWFSGASAFGTGGNGTEAGFAGAQSFINVARPGPTAFRSDAQAHLIFLTDTREQSSTSASAMQTFLNQKVHQPVAHGILCPEGGDCGDQNETNPGKYHTLIRNTGGVIGNIDVFNPDPPTSQQVAQQTATIEAILSAVIGGTGTQLQRPPISSSIKVAVASTKGACNAADVPRDRTHGWDIDAATRRLVFYGNCIPSASGVKVAVSYKYWNDGSADPAGDPCNGTCVAPMVCDPNQKACVCAADCGGCGIGFKCNQQTCGCEFDPG